MKKMMKGALLAALAAAGLTAAQAATIQVTSDITVSTTWTPDNEYVLTKPLYVTNGATLTIEAGTVVRGEGESSAGANDPGTLVITRGSKIKALGTALRPITFTDLNDDNIGENPGTAPYDDRLNNVDIQGQWGGLVVLGRGYVANNSAAGPNAAREVQIEGLTATGGLGLYGNCAAAYPAPYGKVCDDDDSGILRYISIRYGGFNLSANNEINGITLGAVGRTTELDFMEVYQTKDDMIECFGGAPQFKHFIGANGGDDGIDTDEGFRGKVQFALIVQGQPSSNTATVLADKGSEQDGGNSPDGSQPRAIPTYYNVTMIGLGAQKTGYTGKNTNSGLIFRDNAGGRWYNSFLGDFGGVPVCIEGDATSSTGNNTSGQRSITPYVPDNNLYLGPPSDFELELQDNEFWCFGQGSLVPTSAAQGSSYCSVNLLHHDNGLFSNASLGNRYRACTDPLPIRTLTRSSFSATRPDNVDQIDPLPADGSVLLTVDRTPPADGFFEAAPYKGAFGPNDNWARGWSTLDRLGYFPPKPTVTINADVTVSQTWTPDKDYIVGKPVYVTNGATLTILPGTVIRGEGESASGANDPGTLVVSRGSKIIANGTPRLPIVFTDLNDSNVPGRRAEAPYDSRLNNVDIQGQWGGLVVLGRGYVANNTAAGPSATREVQIEGLTAAGGLGLYGNCAAAYPAPYGKVCDDDDSGSLKFISIRYGGFNLSANNEINGITLGAVGRSTDLDYMEVYQTKDDMIECFGGAPQFKHFVGSNGGDDGIDTDEGFRGKVQYAFIMQGQPSANTATVLADKGSEQDGGNSPDGSQPRAIPTYANVTMIGLGAAKTGYTGRNSNSGLIFRDNAGGRWYNSFLGDFGGVPVCIEGDATSSTGNNTSGQRSAAAYTPDGSLYLGPDSDFELELQDNEFWCFGQGALVPTTAAQGTTHCNVNLLHHDNGLFSNAALGNRYRACTDPLPIRNLSRTGAVSTRPDNVNQIDPRPAVGGVLEAAGRRTTVGSDDGFFEPAAYKGAFAPGTNWAEGWTALDRLGYFPKCDPINGESALPDEVLGLTIASDKKSLAWALPLALDSYSGFDLLRSNAADNFLSATCVESNGGDTKAVDTFEPVAGNAAYYLVRARSRCGSGTLGRTSAGAERTAVGCP